MLINIRACFDIANATLASYLRISRDLMQSISCDRRAWPLEALHTATELFRALKADMSLDKLEYVDEIVEREKGEARPLLSPALKTLERQLSHKRAELKKLEKTRAETLRGLNACRLLLETNISAHKRSWLEMRKRHLSLKLKENGLEKLCLLEAEVAGLEARLSRIKSF